MIGHAGSQGKRQSVGPHPALLASPTLGRVPTALLLGGLVQTREAGPGKRSLHPGLASDRRRVEQPPKTRARAVQAGTDCALRQREAVRDFLQAEVEMVVGNDHIAVVVGELGEGRAHPRVALVVGGSVVRALDRVVFRNGWQGREVIELKPLHHARPRPALRAHEHEGFVCGDAKKPGRKTRVPSKRPYSTHDLHQGGLEQIATVVVRHRIAQELALDVRCEIGEEAPHRSAVTARHLLNKFAVDAERHGRFFPERSSKPLIAKLVPAELWSNMSVLVVFETNCRGHSCGAEGADVGFATAATNADTRAQRGLTSAELLWEVVAVHKVTSNHEDFGAPPERAPTRLEHALPAGMRDFLPEEAERRRTLARSLTGALELRGYGLVVPPVFEFSSVLERGLGTLPSADVLRFIEPESGEVAALRPDVTPQIARIIATRLQDRPPPFRLAYEGTVVRRRSGRARKHRQLPQVGVELVGVGGLPGDIEVLEAAKAALEAAGLREFVFDLGDAGVARPLIEALPPSLRADATAALMARDAARLDALTQGLSPMLSRLARTGGTRADLDEVIAAAQPSASRDSLLRLAALHDAACARGFLRHISLDVAEVRGFAYYTGLIFRIYAPGPGEALGGGGRYDELMGRFGAPMPAVGFGLDLDALSVALESAGGASRAPEPRVLVVADATGARAAELRAAGIVAASHSDPETARAHARAWGYTHVVEGDALMVLATGARVAYSVDTLKKREGA